MEEVLGARFLGVGDWATLWEDKLLRRLWHRYITGFNWYVRRYWGRKLEHEGFLILFSIFV